MCMGWHYHRRAMWHTPPPAYEIVTSFFFFANRVQILFSNNVLKEGKPYAQPQAEYNWSNPSTESHFLWFLVSGSACDGALAHEILRNSLLEGSWKGFPL